VGLIYSGYSGCYSPVEALLADEDRLYRRLHVVVDAAPASALEQGEGPVVGVAAS
jgi:hypothetical protein